jgi:5-methylcytosine-specific restriction endonuclease McrA
MTNEDLTVLILDKLDWDYDKLLNPTKYTNTPEVLAGDLILLVLECSNTKDISPRLNIGHQSLNRILAKELQPIFGKLNGGGESWKFKLMTYVEFKVCSDCKNLLHFSSFDKDTSNSSGIHHYCKVCRKVVNANTYRKDSTQESHKRSQEKNYISILARNALYRVERAKRSVIWADLTKIKEMYANCPKGLHVDHIIPLKGELVSGLHVHNNLQYLSPEDNMQKGNRFEV